MKVKRTKHLVSLSVTLNIDISILERVILKDFKRGGLTSLNYDKKYINPFINNLIYYYMLESDLKRFYEVESDEPNGIYWNDFINNINNLEIE